MNERSPFVTTRYEQLSEPVIWIPPWIDELEGEKSIYLPGCRGTGKTTLLKALNYEVRLTNSVLKGQLGANPFRDRYLGLYLRMPDFVTKSFSRWGDGGVSAKPLSEQHELAFAFMLEFQILDLLVDAILNMRDADVFRLDVSAENQAFAKIMYRSEELERFRGDDTGENLRTLGRIFSRAHKHLQWQVFNNNNTVDLSEIPNKTIGGSLFKFSKILIDAASASAPTKKPWRIKVCLDEAECLLPWQQVVLNTIVRLASAPVSFVVAYVSRDIEANRTMISNQPLTNADRTLMEPLENMPRIQFQQLTHAVVNRYLSQVGQKSPISVDHLLGPTQINSLLYDCLRRNKSQKSMAFLEQAKANARLPYFRLSDTRNDTPESEYGEHGGLDTGDVPPLYQTYIFSRLGRNVPTMGTRNWERRQQESREIRKVMVAALLCMCNEYKWEIPYAGSHVAYQLSDQCIRDFLDIMHCLYLESNAGRNLRRFSRKEGLAQKLQVGAFRKASENKVSCLRSEIPYFTPQVLSLIDTLGKLLAKLHGDHRDPRALASPERGLFVIRLKQGDENGKRCIRYIQHGVDGGAIKFHRSTGTQIEFSLHHLLAPHFGFSYRGPYYKTYLDPAMLLACVDAKDPAQASSMQSHLFTSVIGATDETQPPLPFVEIQ